MSHFLLDESTRAIAGISFPRNALVHKHNAFSFPLVFLKTQLHFLSILILGLTLPVIVLRPVVSRSGLPGLLRILLSLSTLWPKDRPMLALRITRTPREYPSNKV